MRRKNGRGGGGGVYEGINSDEEKKCSIKMLLGGLRRQQCSKMYDGSNAKRYTDGINGMHTEFWGCTKA